MKRIGPAVVMTLLGLMCAAGAYAQTQRYDPATPSGVPQQRVDPAGELAQPAAAPRPPRLIQNQRRSRRDADARHCLALSANKAVHRCSLPYRSRATKRAAATRAKSKAASQQPISREASKPASVVKRAPPRPGDTAKAAELVKPMDVTRPGGTPTPVAPASPAPASAKAAQPPSGVPAPITTPGAPAKK